MKLSYALFLDFYLPEYNIAIECQGIQHFEPCKRFGGFINYEKTIKRDKIKFELCKKHNIKILYYTNIGKSKIPDDYFSKIYTDKEDLLNEIKTFNSYTIYY